MFKGKRFTPAMIVAVIALAVALSGTAVAGTAKLITGSQIADGTIKLTHLSKSGKPALKGDRGATGTQRTVGAQDAQSPVGPQRGTGAKVDAGASGDPSVDGKDGATGTVGPQGPAGIVNAVKTAFCLDTSAGTMTFKPGVWASGTSCGIGKTVINVYVEG